MSPMIETVRYRTALPRPISWRTKINPLWWFENDEGVDPTYMPDSEYRSLFWFFRNFMWNFFKYVVGFEDRNLVATGPYPVMTTTWYDHNGTKGWKWAWIRPDGLPLSPSFPFVSYSGARVIWYLGWLPSGGRLGAKFNLVNH